jgi:hypothetical protein
VEPLGALVTTLTALVTTLTALVTPLTALVTTLTALVTTLTALVTPLTARLVVDVWQLRRCYTLTTTRAVSGVTLAFSGASPAVLAYFPACPARARWTRKNEKPISAAG